MCYKPAFWSQKRFAQACFQCIFYVCWLAPQAPSIFQYYVTGRVWKALPLAVVSAPLRAKSSRFRSSFSASILCMVPWYADRVRSTDSKMSLTVALNISFREHSRMIFRLFDLAILHRATAALNNSPEGLRQVCGQMWVCAVLLPCTEQTFVGTKQRQSLESDDKEELATFWPKSVAPLPVWSRTTGLAGVPSYHMVLYCLHRQPRS